jgi:ADP-ribose pyrophosphatase YjhB (NUDIX family)
MGYIEDIRAQVGHAPIILTFAGGILVDDQNRVLMQKRSDFSGWGLFGGAMEYGETAEQACKREFREECGIDVAIDRLFGVSTNNIQHYQNGDVAQAVVITFIVHQVGGQLAIASDETSDFAFFAENELPPIFTDQHARAIHNYYAGMTTFYE